MKWILHAADAVDSPDVGGKARGLAQMQRAGLPVPSWVVLSSRALSGSLTSDQRAELQHAVRDLCPDGEPVAVRSSASQEDGARHSFAGQLESFLDVSHTQVAERVLDVWRSGFSPRVRAYQRERGLGPGLHAPAVIVQRMVRAHTSGIAFSADPVTGRRGVAVVTGVRGVGAPLASGEAVGDTWLVDRKGSIIERRVLSGAPALLDEEVRAVWSLAKAAERCAGAPQDIEWALEDRLFLLQSRPITSIVSLPDPDAPLTIWDNSNIVESYSGTTTPLTFSFAREIYEHVYPEFCRVMGVREREIASNEEVFRNMLGLVQGRMYYNLLNWHRMLALLPGYSLNRRFMEQMMGVREPLPNDVAKEIEAGATTGRVRDLWAVARTAAGLLINHLSVDRQVDAFFSRIRSALAAPVPSLEDRRPDELAAHYRELRARLLRSWQAPIVNDFFAMLFYGLLRQMVRRWIDDPEGALQNDLLGGEGAIVSAEPALRMQQLARLAATDEGFLELLRTGPRDEIVAAVHGHREFLDEYRAYLEKFGERTVNELKLESATLHDDPLPLFRAVGRLALLMKQREDASMPARSAGDGLRAAAAARVKRSLAHSSFRRVVFNWVLRHARRRVRDRENLRLERTRLFGRVRRILLELGRRLTAEGVLDDPRDVLYLEVDEVLEFVDGRSTCTDLRALAEIREREFAAFEKLAAPPARFETRGVVYLAPHESTRAAAPRFSVAAEEFQGMGCSPGFVSGRVRLVTDPNDIDLTERSILVAEHTDPGWITLFPLALGLIVERGSLLSHAAIVARELGIPAIVSAPDITRRLKDGDFVEMDGSTGRIHRRSASEGAERCA